MFFTMLSGKEPSGVEAVSFENARAGRDCRRGWRRGKLLSAWAEKEARLEDEGGQNHRKCSLQYNCKRGGQIETLDRATFRPAGQKRGKRIGE
jgi:hypothetical protein